MRLLIVTTELVPVEQLESAVGESLVGADVLIVAPAVTESRLSYWLSDTDSAEDDAARRAVESARQVRARGIHARGRSRDSDPLVTVDDAMREFDPDRVVVIKHPGDQEVYREGDLVTKIRERVRVPVEHRDAPAED